MLGSLKSKTTWSWAAWGKHPVAKDFFSIGPSTPLIKAFSDWVKNGFRMLNSKGNHESQIRGWRFWAKGPTRGNLICGVGKDSSDSFGRPYPLIIMGSGFLNKWEGYWSLLPFALERTWLRIEYMSTRRFADFNQIEDEISTLKPPTSDWSELENQRESHHEFQLNHKKNAFPEDFSGMEKKISGLAERSEFFVLLENRPPNDPLKQAGLWHFFLQKHFGEMPHAVFMGGVPQEAYLAVFRRPLTPKDFVRLWTVSSKGAIENGDIITGKETH